MSTLRHHASRHLLPALLLSTAVQMWLGYVLMLRPLLLQQVDAMQAELQQRQPVGLFTELAHAPAQRTRSWLPFNRLLGERIRSLGWGDGRVYVGEGGHGYWMQLDQPISRVVYFDYADSVGASPRLTFVMLLGLTLLIALATAAVLAWSWSRPLLRLEQQLARLGSVDDANTDAVVMDITELASVQHRFLAILREVNTLARQRTTLLFGLSHDLRAPLTRLRMQLALLDDLALEKKSALQGDLQCIIDIVDAFCDAGNQLARSVTPRTLANCFIALQEQWTHCQQLVWQLAEEDARPQAVNCPALLLAIGNLIRNALQHGQAPVTITAYGKAGWTFTVHDRGPGPTGVEPGRIWQPFASGKEDHSGLGLAIVRLLCEQNGWQVEQGVSPDGCVFRVFLPDRDQETKREHAVS